MQKINIYLKKVPEGFIEDYQCFSTHLPEQTLNENNNGISEIIKENSYQEFDSSLIEEDGDLLSSNSTVKNIHSKPKSHNLINQIVEISNHEFN